MYILPSNKINVIDFTCSFQIIWSSRCLTWPRRFQLIRPSLTVVHQMRPRLTVVSRGISGNRISTPVIIRFVFSTKLTISRITLILLLFQFVFSTKFFAGTKMTFQSPILGLKHGPCCMELVHYFNDLNFRWPPLMVCCSSLLSKMHS